MGFSSMKLQNLELFVIVFLSVIQQSLCQTVPFGFQRSLGLNPLSFSSGSSLPGLLGLLGGLGNLQSVTTSNGTTQIYVQINGLQNLTVAQQQAFAAALASSISGTGLGELSGLGGFNGLSGIGGLSGLGGIGGLSGLGGFNGLSGIGGLSGLGGIGGLSGLGGFNGLIGQPLGLQVGNFLGTTGLAAAAAQHFANPLNLVGGSPFVGGTPFTVNNGLGLPSGQGLLGLQSGLPLSGGPLPMSAGGAVFVPAGSGGFTSGQQQLDLTRLGALLQANGAGAGLPPGSQSQIVGTPVFVNG